MSPACTYIKDNFLLKLRFVTAVNGSATSVFKSLVVCFYYIFILVLPTTILSDFIVDGLNTKSNILSDEKC